MVKHYFLTLIILSLLSERASAQLGLEIISNPNAGCSDLSVSFIGIGAQGITNWYWDFGDGSTSNLQSPLHVYSILPGDQSTSFDVKLTASNGLVNDSVTNLNYIQVEPSPIASFIVNANGSNEYSFVNQSVGNITSQSWDFGDGAVDASQNPVHTYDEGGNYTIVLDVYSSNGCFDTAYQEVMILNVGSQAIDRIKIGPNPIRHGQPLIVALNGATLQYESVFNAAGVKMKNDFTESNGLIRINTEELTSGTYFCTLNGTHGQPRKLKFIVVD